MDDLEECSYYSDKVATLGDRIHYGRELMGISQKELARRLGVKLITIRAWENDSAELRANKAQMLSGLLGVSMKWLLTGEGEGPDGPMEMEIEATSLGEVINEMHLLQSDISKISRRLSVLDKRLRIELTVAKRTE